MSRWTRNGRELGAVLRAGTCGLGLGAESKSKLQGGSHDGLALIGQQECEQQRWKEPPEPKKLNPNCWNNGSERTKSTNRKFVRIKIMTASRGKPEGPTGNSRKEKCEREERSVHEA